MVETGWYTNTFKSLARQRQTAHLCGRFAKVVLSGSVSPAVCTGRYSRYVWRIDRNHCSLRGPILAESPQNVVQCIVHDTRTNVSL